MQRINQGLLDHDRVFTLIKIVSIFMILFAFNACTPSSDSSSSAASSESATPSPSVAQIFKFDAPGSILAGGSTVNIPFIMDGKGIQKVQLQFAIDGVQFKDEAIKISVDDGQITWIVPKINVNTAKLKVIVTNFDNTQTVKTSRAFSIDSILPLAPSITGSNYALSTTYLFTALNCDDTQALFISESSATPSKSNSKWISCVTTPNGLSTTLSSTNNIKTLYFWAKDAAGNISNSSTQLIVTLDTTIPTVSISTPTSGTIFNSSNYGNVVFSGDCSEEGQMVHLIASDGVNTNTANTLCHPSQTPNWSYTMTFAGLSGTTVSLVANHSDIAGNVGTSAPVSVTLYLASLTNSTLSVSPSSIQNGQTSTITLTLKDANNTQLNTGGYHVSFTATGGTSTGTLTAVTDNNNGTYTAVFTGTARGTAKTISASVTEIGNITQTQTLTVTNAQPVITPLANSTYPINGTILPLIQGTSANLATASDLDGDSVTLSCTYQSLGLNASDPNYATAGTNCSTLDTITTSGTPATVIQSKLTSSTSGTLTWTPTYTQRGTYQFTFAATDGSLSATPQTVIVTVRENFVTQSLLAGFDALNSTQASGLSASTPSAPFTAAATPGSWLNLSSATTNGTLTFGTANPWGGTGQASISSVDPYRVSFTSANSDSIDLGTTLNTSTKFAASTWIKPGSPSTAGSIILGNGGGTGNGFALRQSTTPANRASFVIGQKYYSYRDLVLSDKPVSYWRFNESSGNTATDLTSYGKNGTYSGTNGTNYNLSQTGVIAGDTDTAVQFNGNGGLSLGSSNYANVSTNDFSIEGWFKTSTIPAPATWPVIFQKEDNTGGRTGYDLVFQPSSGYISFNMYSAGTYLGGVGSAGSKTDGNWHYFVVLRSSTTLKMYVDGTQVNISTNASYSTNLDNAGFGLIGNGYNGLYDEFAFYNYALTPTQITEHYQTGLNGNYKAYPGNAVLADKPVGYWRLGEKSGSVAYDSSGNGYDGQYTGGVTLAQAGALVSAGDSNNSAQFDGSTSHAVLGNSSILSFERTDVFSGEAWVKTNSASQMAVISKLQNSAPYSGWEFEVAGGKLSLTLINTFSSNTLLINSSNTVNDNNWHHIAFTYNGSSTASGVKFYIDGVSNSGVSLYDSLSGTIINNLAPNIGARAGGNFYLSANLDELAIYNYALSPTQIAAHYNSGKGPGWWTCQSQTQLNSSNWNLLSTIYDGTTAKLFVNGQQECSVTPGTTYSGTVANTVAGSNSGRTSNFWQGLLSAIKLYGTSDGSAPATSTTIKTNFDSEANRYRSVPQENIVTNGLVLSLDAANAKQGLAPYSNGCATTDLSWFDLSASSLISKLFNFSGCNSSSGWVGDGSVANPYALALDGTNDYVSVTNSTSLNLYPMTISVWFKTTMNSATYPAIASNYSAANGYNFYFNNGNICAWYFKDSSNKIYNGDATSLCTAGYNNGNWHHASYVVGPSGGLLYVDGTQVSTLAWTGTPGASSSTLNLAIGNYGGSILPGSIATVRIYNRNLSTQEIKQNCLSQEHRFTNTPQSICAAP